MRQNLYTVGEISFMRDNAGVKTAGEMSELMGRSKGSIQATAHKHGISLKTENVRVKTDGRSVGVRFDTHEKRQAAYARLLTEVFSGKA